MTSDRFESITSKAPNQVFASIVLGAIAGFCYSLLIPIVMGAIASGDMSLDAQPPDLRRFFGFEVSHPGFAAAFAAVCCLIIIARSSSQIILLRVSMDVASRLRQRICLRIAQAPIDQLERIGPAKLIATLTADVPSIIAGASLLPDLLISLVTVIGMLSFLLYLNTPVFVFAMGAVIFGAITYQIPMLLCGRYFAHSREKVDDLHEALRGLIHGVKELKLSRQKREAFFGEILGTAERSILRHEKRGASFVRVTINYGDMLSFFVVGATAFVFINYHAISHAELVGVVMTLLYISSPIAALLNLSPQFVHSRVALRKLQQVLQELPREAVAAEAISNLRWNEVRFVGVTYRYPSSGEDGGFQVGPVDLGFRKGEVTFVVGGNGSGKSTLGKLLCLHYPPATGSIHFGEHRVDASTIAACRNQIAAINSDYYLFDRLIGVDHSGSDAKIDAYLKELRLDTKLRIEQGRFSTRALSDGQRKRLALLAACMEDKDLYLFDEWAAEQDPEFKQFFYRRLLQDLRARNKAVVVITHDDRYFDVADKVLVMREGCIDGHGIERPIPSN